MWGFTVMIVVGINSIGQCQYIDKTYEPILPVFIRGVFNGVHQDSTPLNLSQQSQSEEADTNDAVIVNLVNRTINEINEVIINSAINDDSNKNDSSLLESKHSTSTPRSVIDFDTSNPKPIGNKYSTKSWFL